MRVKRFTAAECKLLIDILEANDLGPCSHPDCDPKQPSCASNYIHLRALAAVKSAYCLGRAGPAFTTERSSQRRRER
jgi:hypothetical protein